MRTPQGAAGLKPILSRLDVPEKNAISRILISVAHADGRVDPNEVRQLEKLYASIGLEKDRGCRGYSCLGRGTRAGDRGLSRPGTRLFRSKAEGGADPRKNGFS